MEKQTVTVRVPATVSNFGGTGDCGTLALAASLNVKVTRRLDGEVNIRYFGENGERIPRDSSNLVVRAMETALHLKKLEFTGGDFEIYSSVPVSVGLGSSTAAVLAGLIAANNLYRLKLEEKTLLDLAAIFENRPGNLRAAWWGGFVSSGDAAASIGQSPSSSAAAVFRQTLVPENFALRVVVPETSLVARAAKSAQTEVNKASHPLRRASDMASNSAVERAASKVALQDAALRLDRATALAKFFVQQEESALAGLAVAFPPTCQKRVAGLKEALEVRAPGLLSLFICGSGPAVGVFAGENPDQAVRAVAESFARHGVGSSCFEFRPSNSGALDWNEAQSELALPADRLMRDSQVRSSPLPV